jgi:hypothetical protein
VGLIKNREAHQLILTASMAAAERFAQNSQGGGYFSHTRRTCANLVALLRATAAHTATIFSTWRLFSCQSPRKLQHLGGSFAFSAN